MRLKLAFAALFLATGIPASPQITPAASEGSSSLKVGIGYSNYYTDWNGRLAGPTLWADWNFYQGPSFLRGLGMEVEGRDLNYGRTGSDAKLRQDTAAGGVIYTWRHNRKFQPYGKFLVGYGSIDFNVNVPGYTHDSRTVYAPGGGAEYRAWRNVWLRGNYEYQFWTNFVNHHALNPNGFTIGASYEFRRGRRH